MTEVTLRTLLDGGRYFEGPRWHAGRLWFVDCMARKLLSIGTSGDVREHAVTDDTPCGLGILPDGRLIVLTMFKKRLLAWSDGKLSLYADLSHVAAGTIDDMIVDGQGRAYVGDLGFDMPPPPGRGADGRIILVMPDGSARVVAEGLRFPNGIAVSADHRRLVVAEMEGECLAEYEIEADGGLRLARKIALRKGSGRHLSRSATARSGSRPLPKTPLCGSRVTGRNCNASRCPAGGRLPVRWVVRTAKRCSASAPTPRTKS